MNIDPISPTQTTITPADLTDPKKGNFMFHIVTWIREDGDYSNLRKGVGIIMAIFLTATGVGLVLVIPGIFEWNRQVSVVNILKAQENQKIAEQANKLKPKKNDSDSSDGDDTSHDKPLVRRVSLEVNTNKRDDKAKKPTPVSRIIRKKSCDKIKKNTDDDSKGYLSDDDKRTKSKSFLNRPFLKWEPKRTDSEHDDETSDTEKKSKTTIEITNKSTKAGKDDEDSISFKAETELNSVTNPPLADDKKKEDQTIVN